jgi:hypothetical protein
MSPTTISVASSNLPRMEKGITKNLAKKLRAELKDAPKQNY